ncbi:MAG TPA: protease modulator HflK [Candidatus Methylacidiphilales bacterium]
MTTQPRHFAKPTALLGVDEAKSVRGALLGFVILHGLAAGLTIWILLQNPTLIFLGLAMFVLWGALSAALHFGCALCETSRSVSPSVDRPRTYIARLGQFPRFLKNRFSTFTQWFLYLGGVAGGAALLLPGFNYLREPAQILPADLRFASVVFLGIAAVLYLYGNYIQILQNRLQTEILQPIIRLSLAMLAAYALTAGILFVFLASGYDTCWLGWVWIGLSATLVVEPLVLAVARFYQPKALRKEPQPIGASLLLEFVHGSGHGAKELVHDFEELVGAKVGEVWILGFLKETIEIVFVAGLLLGWLSTCLRTVPIANEGVLISFGHYEQLTLKPGLHLLLPWPLQELQLVETQRLRDVSLGFDKDLSGPLLWTAKHVEGEKNMLVDDGESLLTVNVPIMYRVSSPVTFLKNTIDAQGALRYLAERKLIQIAGTRESFHIMTEDRAPIANALKQGLQREADRLGLGVEIVYVGLKDIHPPVDVAPAYENVISSEEKKEALIDDAMAYGARVLPDAKAQAKRLVVSANAAYTNRVEVATGEGTRFTLVLPASRAHSGLLHLRLEYDALDEVLPAPAKTIIGLAPGSTPDCYLDLRTYGDNRASNQILTH